MFETGNIAQRTWRQNPSKSRFKASRPGAYPRVEPPRQKNCRNVREEVDSRYGNSIVRPINRLAFSAKLCETRTKPTLMNDKSKLVMWLCFTLLVAAGMKYVPPYLLEQRRLDIEERVLDLREEAFLHQRDTPTVSVPVAVHAQSSQLL